MSAKEKCFYFVVIDKAASKFVMKLKCQLKHYLSEAYSFASRIFMMLHNTYYYSIQHIGIDIHIYLRTVRSLL